jgi:hypothetical protein
MSEEVVNETFYALFALTDLRQILRETKPWYKLSDDQKERVKEIVLRLRQSADFIEKVLT